MYFVSCYRCVTNPRSSLNKLRSLSLSGGSENDWTKFSASPDQFKNWRKEHFKSHLKFALAYNSSFKSNCLAKIFPLGVFTGAANYPPPAEYRIPKTEEISKSLFNQFVMHTLENTKTEEFYPDTCIPAAMSYKGYPLDEVFVELYVYDQGFRMLETEDDVTLLNFIKGWLWSNYCSNNIYKSALLNFADSEFNPFGLNLRDKIMNTSKFFSTSIYRAYQTQFLTFE